jgi:hypothetical protein
VYENSFEGDSGDDVDDDDVDDENRSHDRGMSGGDCDSGEIGDMSDDGCGVGGGAAVAQAAAPAPGTRTRRGSNASCPSMCCVRPRSLRRRRKQWPMKYPSSVNQ